jgi:hypothetical protein
LKPTKRPSTGDHGGLGVDVNRAIDQELNWFFAFAEAAKRSGSITFLPTLVATQMAAEKATDDEMLATAQELVTTVQAALDRVPTRHASVLRAAYTRRRWPVSLRREFARLTPIVARIACIEDPWPARTSRDSLEFASAVRLARGLAKDVGRPAALRKQARQLMGEAITAYVRARTKGATPSTHT